MSKPVIEVLGTPKGMNVGKLVDALLCAGADAAAEVEADELLEEEEADLQE